jgi:hypothetical protein
MFCDHQQLTCYIYIYPVDVCMKIKYILSIKSTEFAKCDAFYMNNSGFVKLIKLYLYPYLQYGFADSLLAGQGMIHKTPGKRFRQHTNCRERV